MPNRTNTLSYFSLLCSCSRALFKISPPPVPLNVLLVTIGVRFIKDVYGVAVTTRNAVQTLAAIAVTMVPNAARAIVATRTLATPARTMSAYQHATLTSNAARVHAAVLGNNGAAKVMAAAILSVATISVVPRPRNAAPIQMVIIAVPRIKPAVMIALVHRRAKKLVVKRSAAQKIIHRAEHALVFWVIVLLTRRGFIQIGQYTIAVEDALASVIMKNHPHLAMMSISAMTGFNILLQSVQVGQKRARYHWNVMMQVCLGDVLVASRAAITVPCMLLAGYVISK